MNTLTKRLNLIRAQITKSESRHHRPAGSVMLLAVSKTHSINDIKEAFAAGQRHFGESYLQDALPKITALANKNLCWHFIGPIQSNKTRAIAENFHWVHSIDRLKLAQRLSQQRPEHLPPLNVCLQVNISQDPIKAGIHAEDIQALSHDIQKLPHLKLRGLMTIPNKASDFEQQRIPFHALAKLFKNLQQQGMVLDTLSMGMSGDMDAAIAEGATIVRIGTAIFGERALKK